METKKECCVIVYNSYQDPLNQNLMLQYIKTLTKNLKWKFHLITFEQPQYEISPSHFHEIKAELRINNIEWYPQKHHTGRFLLLKKAYDFCSIGYLLFRLRISGVRVLWSFANVAASIAWVYSKILKFKTIIYSYEPHSAFMAELGLWSDRSIKFKLLNYLEQKAGLEATYVMTGTKYMVEELTNKGARGKIYRAPTSVDETDFYFRPEARSILSMRHNYSDSDKIILYIGKFGGLYYTWQIPLLFKLIAEHVPNSKFVVISPNACSEIEEYFNEVDWKIGRITYLTNLPYDEVKHYISASNIGISAVPPTPSQKFRSPTKVAEYLLCGLPYVTCKGVSEDDIVAEQYNVGVVLNEFSEKSILKAMPAIKSFLHAEKHEISVRCRHVGLMYRSKKNIDDLLEDIFKSLA